MNDAQLQDKLAELLDLPHEIEWVEFKHNRAVPQEVGEYLSALSNAAALHRQPHGFIAWGIEDGTHVVKGTTFKPHRTKGAGNEDLEPWLARQLSPRMDFEIFEFNIGTAPVVLFEIQAANSAPVAFSGCEWIRVGSHKKPLREFAEKERELWKILSVPKGDWSEEICAGAKIGDLDPEAISLNQERRLAFRHSFIHFAAARLSQTPKYQGLAISVNLGRTAALHTQKGTNRPCRMPLHACRSSQAPCEQRLANRIVGRFSLGLCHWRPHNLLGQAGR